MATYIYDELPCNAGIYFVIGIEFEERPIERIGRLQVDGISSLWSVNRDDENWLVRLLSLDSL